METSNEYVVPKQVPCDDYGVPRQAKSDYEVPGSKFQAEYDQNENNNVYTRKNPVCLIMNAPPETRKKFIIKVYATLFLQFCVTACVGVAFRFAFRDDEANHVSIPIEIWLTIYLLSAVLFPVSYVIVVYCSKVARTSPWKYIILCVLTLSMSTMVAMISVHIKTELVAICFGITAGLFIFLSVFAVSVGKDFTGCIPFLAAIFYIAVVWIILVFATRVFYVDYPDHPASLEPIRLGVGAACVLLFAMFIVYDTQLIVGGNKEFEFNTDEFIIAAVYLYVDVMYMFLYMLYIVAQVAGSN